MIPMIVSVEIPIFLLFIGFVVYLTKKDKKSLKLVFYLILYALLFENVNVILSRNNVGGYYYNPGFILLGHVPLFVVLSWVMIIYSSMRITDSFSFSDFSKPFVDSLLAVLVDLSIDVVAIRLGFWFWQGYRLTAGWFGVPGNNFIGWLLVAFTFCYLWRNYSKKLGFFIIPLAYATYFILFMFLIKPFESILPQKTGELFIFGGLLIVFLLMFLGTKKKIQKVEKTPLMIYLIRVPFFLFGLIGLFAFGFYKESNILAISSALCFLLETSIFLSSHHIRMKKTK